MTPSETRIPNTRCYSHESTSTLPDLKSSTLTLLRYGKAFQTITTSREIIMVSVMRTFNTAVARSHIQSSPTSCNFCLRRECSTLHLPGPTSATNVPWQIMVVSVRCSVHTPWIFTNSVRRLWTKSCIDDCLWWEHSIPLFPFSTSLTDPPYQVFVEPCHWIRTPLVLTNPVCRFRMIFCRC